MDAIFHAERKRIVAITLITAVVDQIPHMIEDIIHIDPLFVLGQEHLLHDHRTGNSFVHPGSDLDPGGGFGHGNLCGTGGEKCFVIIVGVSKPVGRCREKIPLQFFVIDLFHSTIRCECDLVPAIFDDRRFGHRNFFLLLHRLFRHQDVTERRQRCHTPVHQFFALRPHRIEHQCSGCVDRDFFRQSLKGFVCLFRGSSFRLFDPCPMLHPCFVNTLPLIAAGTVRMFIVAEQSIPRTVERCCGVGIFFRVEMCGKDSQFFRRWQSPVRCELPSQQFGRGEGVLIPSAGNIAGKDGDLIAELCPHLFKGFVIISGHAQSRKEPFFVPESKVIAQIDLRFLIVRIACHAPDVIGIFLFQQGKHLCHTLLDFQAVFRKIPVHPGMDPECGGTVFILGRRPEKEFAFSIRCEPVKEHGQSRGEPDIAAGSAPTGIAVPEIARRRAVDGIHGGKQGIPMIGREKEIPVSGRNIRSDQRPADAVVVDHGQSPGIHAPFLQKFLPFVRCPAKLFHTINLCMISSQSGGKCDLSGPDVILHHRRRFFPAPIHAVIVPEPCSLHGIVVAVFRSFPFFRLFHKRDRLIQKTAAVVPLDVLGIVQTDVRVGCHGKVHLPLPGQRPHSTIFGKNRSVPG